MRVFIVLCLCATAYAVPQGYNYQQQQQQQHQQQQQEQVQKQPIFNFNSQPTVNQLSQGFIQDALKTTNLPSTLGGHNTQTQQFSTAPQFSQPIRQQQQHHFGLANAKQQNQPPFGGSFGGQQQYQSYQPQRQLQNPGTVTKDIYVHVAPEEHQESQYQQNLPPLPPRKHYRIVFIKAPAPKVNPAALRIKQAPIEEKTIIYVLTKKPDPLELQAAIQEAQPKQPSKPEVYFIKYKTQEEAQHAQRTIQAQYDKLGGTTQISDEGIAPVTSVIGSLDGQQQTGDLSTQSVTGHSSSPSSSSTFSSSSSSSSSPSSGTRSNVNKYLPPIVKL